MRRGNFGEAWFQDRSCTAGISKEPVEGLSRVAYVAMSGEGQQDALAQVDNLDDLKKIALAVGGRRNHPLSPFAVLSAAFKARFINKIDTYPFIAVVAGNG